MTKIPYIVNRYHIKIFLVSCRNWSLSIWK